MAGSKDELNAQLEPYELIYNTAPMGIALLNQQYEFINCNPTLLQKLGFSAVELGAKTLIEICHPWDRQKTLSLLENVRNQQSSNLREEIRLFQKEESFLWVQISVHHISPESNTRGQYVVMIQNIHQQKEMRLELIELRRSLMVNNEMERKKLAQALHDGPMQDLHSITFQLAGLLDEVNPEHQTELQSVLDTTKNANQKLRTIAYDLRPPALTKFGLSRSIKALVDEFALKNPEIFYKFDLEPQQDEITEEISLTLFRICQQSLVNIVRHANATEVEIRFYLEDDTATLEVIDNGEGFNVPDRWVSLVRAGHYGLADASDRVSSQGGEFKVSSTPGEGTRIFVQIPDCKEY